MSLQTTIREEQYIELKRNLSKNARNYIKIYLTSVVMNSLCALLFYYIEHCYTPVTKDFTNAEKVVLKTCKMLNDTKYQNDSSLLNEDMLKICRPAVVEIERKERRKQCDLTAGIFLEWFSFCYIVSLTIGYGDLTPLSNVGRAIFMVVALPSIGLAASYLMYAGEVLVTLTKISLVKFERVVFRRSIVVLCLKKVFVALMVVMVIFMLLCTVMAKEVFGDSETYLSTSYYVFVSFTTVGFGDITTTQEMRREKKLASMTSFICMSFAMAAIASVLTFASDITKSFKVSVSKTNESEKTIS